MSTPTLLIRCYVWAGEVPESTEQGNALLDDLSDFFVERGYGNEESERIRSIITAGHVDVSDDVQEMVSEWKDDPTVQIIFLPKVGAEV